MVADLLSETGLSLERLQSFCRVAEAGGVTRAAKGDATKQSLYSRQIKELEEFFGAELIRRKGRGVVLTRAGERLNVVARECFASLLDFKGECQGQPIEVVIGTGDSIIQWLLMPRLDQIRKQIPNVRLKFLNLPTADAVKHLADGLIDFAVVRKGAIARPLQAQPLGVMAYSLFVPASLQAAIGKKDGLKLLDRLPLATLEGEGDFRTELAQAARKAGVTMNIQVECSSFTLVARGVAKGTVAGILPAIAAADLHPPAVSQSKVGFLKSFDREMCLASNTRLLRIRPILAQAATALAHLCRF